MLKYIRLIFQTDVNKTDRSKECMFCHYWYFLNKKFSYGPYTCDGCYDIVQRSTDFKNIAIVHIKKSAYRIYFSNMNKKSLIQLIRQEVLIVMIKTEIIIIIIIIIMAIIMKIKMRMRMT